MTTEQSRPYRLSAPLRFDFDAAANKANPFPLFASMRAAGPIIPVKLPFVGKGWVTTSYDATLAMLKDNAAFVQEARHAGRSGVAGMKWWMPRSLKLLTNNMLLKDEPDHRRLRKLVDQAFRRRHVRDMRRNIEQIADRLLDDFEGMDEADLANAYARLLPLEVICELLGLPRQDREVFSTWAKTATSMRSSFGILRAFFSMSGVINYVRDQIEDCRREPREGVISDLVRAEEDGDKLSEDELVSMVFLLLFAGFETTTHLISDSIVALEQNPEQKAYLLADPAGRMERAVEELGRYTTPVQSTKPRYVARDCEFFGQQLRQGDIVMGQLAGANYDPAEFDAPDQLKLDRFPNPHLVFSSGIHFCLGMQLARVEAQVALSRLYARYPNLVLAAPDDIEWIERYGLRGVKALPVRLNASLVRQAA
jgi:cytochrome P450